MIYFCCDERRRMAVGAHPTLRGIDFLEVSPDQRQLFVHFVGVTGKNPVPPNLTRDNVTVTGGERITDIQVVSVSYDGAVLVVTVDDDGNPANGVGDFSTYTLSLVEASVPPSLGLDPLLSSVDFSFKAECPSEFDCKEKRVCPPEPLLSPEIDYLAKDYASFRRLMLDRMALLMPQWKDRNPADLGVALVELLAYVGDHLSYQQDAVSTEAYLGTARKRVSVRRHARLVDYFMHDGCNARVWVHVKVNASADGSVLLGPSPPDNRPGTMLLTKVDVSRGPLPSARVKAAVNAGAQVFETMHDVALREAHNEISFYTWGNERCCLPKGATRATLKGHYSELKAGDVLICEEILGPQTGEPGDADPAHRHAVRLTEVICVKKDGNKLTDLTDPLTGTPITEIQWAAADALPFALCISSNVTDKEHGQKYQGKISVARGNIVVADHGMTIEKEELGTVPEATLFETLRPADDRCAEPARVPVPPRFRPQVKERPVTQAGTLLKVKKGSDGKQKEVRLAFDPEAPASAVFRWEWKNVLPAITLNEKTWNSRHDLLASGTFDKDFVLEVETDGTASLRFGDDQHGARPGPKTKFTASYRIGNGVAGNVGAEAIAHVVTTLNGIEDVRNLLPARGGVDPESIEHVRQSAPYAFRTQERAVTPADYEDLVIRRDVRERCDLDVQRAAATLRWTGSWHTMFLTVDRLGGAPVKEEFETKLRGCLERYRMAGQDLEVDGPSYVSLEVEMHVCVKADYFRSDVKAALLEVFSSRDLPDGRRGLFHPDHFTFGQTVYRSPIYAAAQAVPGVASVHIRKFKRQDTAGTDTETMDNGALTLGRLEIARLDNDRNFPEHGVLRVTLGGGK